MKQFLKQTFASTIGTFIALFLFMALGATGLIAILIAATVEEEGPKVKDESVLVMSLSLPIRDTNPPASLGEALAGEENSMITLRQVLDSLEQAKDDERIVGLFLDGSNEGDIATGYATLKEVRTALEEFKAAGKPIIAYNLAWGERDYYLASIADQVIVNPMGGMEINGLSSQQLFLAGALEKYGVGVQVIRVGKYKSAVEPFINTSFSQENRQQTQDLLWDLWGEFLTTVGKSRELPPKQLQTIASTKGLLLPEEAKSSGLVDQLAYFDEVTDQLKELTGIEEDEDKSFRQISLSTYAEVVESKGRSSRNKIAVVYAEGAIVNGEGQTLEVGSTRFVEELREIRRDEDVKAVVLRVNSPGGSATASEIILRELQLIREDKPVVVSMGDVAASGGYWISTASDRIFAEANTITGSIGVFGLLPNVQELAADNGLNWDVVKTGNFADTEGVNRPKTPQELAIYQKYVDDIYNKFLDKVAKSRNLPKEKVAEIAQGRVWSGKDAKEIGLVDQIGGVDAAIAYAAQKAELEDDWELREYPEQRTLEEELLENLLGESETKQLDPLTAEFLRLKKDLDVLRSLNDPKNSYTRLPFDFRID
ncbi:MAG: signal peptide peptidase SppA [Spirulinaceae cyanobacterium]